MMATSNVQAAGGTSNVRSFRSTLEVENHIFSLAASEQKLCLRTPHRGRDQIKEQSRDALDHPLAEDTIGTIKTVIVREKHLAYVLERNDGRFHLLKPQKGSGGRQTLKYAGWTNNNEFTTEAYVWGLKPNSNTDTGTKPEPVVKTEPKTTPKSSKKRKTVEDPVVEAVSDAEILGELEPVPGPKRIKLVANAKGKGKRRAQSLPSDETREPSEAPAKRRQTSPSLPAAAGSGTEAAPRRSNRQATKPTEAPIKTSKRKYTRKNKDTDTVAPSRALRSNDQDHDPYQPIYNIIAERTRSRRASTKILKRGT